MKRAANLIITIVVIFIAFGLGIVMGRETTICPVCQICQPGRVDFSLFWEVWMTLEDKYLNAEMLQDDDKVQELIYGAISGMISKLDDPYTVFFDPDETKRFNEDIAGEFEGVGMRIGIKNNQLQVIAPLEGTPADRAGMRAGDKILEIDGESTLGISIDEAVSKIRGPKGTEVILTIKRESWDENKDIGIVRDVIQIPSMKWELKEGDIAYLALYHFDQDSSVDFKNTAKEILKSPAKKIVLDLRNNPGGYLSEVRNIGEWFFEDGDIIALEDFGIADPKEYKSEKDGQLKDYPIVCLINQGSASGAEILAGALRDNRDVVLIGEQSFGKGTVQQVIPLIQDPSSLKVTIAEWLTPNKYSINNVGLEPDIKVELTEEDYNADRDPQLDKAMEVIGGL